MSNRYRYLIFRKRKGQMANESSVHRFPPEIIFFLTGSVDHMIGIPINCWALWLIVSGKRSLIESELLTLNLLTMEIACSMCFFLSLIHLLCKVSSLGPLTGFYRGMALVGRAVFQCHVCVDRYLAVVHPMVFIRYKQLRYRGTCLAAVWLVVICSGLTNVFLPSSHNMLLICSAAHLAPALFIELFCSLSIVRILRRPSPGSKEAQGKKVENQQKTRAVKIICMVLVMLVFNMLPFTVLPLTSVSPVVWLPIAFTFSTVGSSAQAFLFLRRAGELPCKR